MPTIKNKLNQPVLICLPKGRSVGLLASGSATITDGDMESHHLKGFIARGEIVILAAEQAVEKTVKTEPGKKTETPVKTRPEKKGEM